MNKKRFDFFSENEQLKTQIKELEHSPMSKRRKKVWEKIPKQWRV